MMHMVSKTSLLSKWLPVLLTLLCLGVIFLFSRENADDSAQTSGNVLRKLLALIHNSSPDDVSSSEIEQYTFLIRKTAHFCIYAALGVCSCWTAYGFFKRFPAGIAWGFCTLYAASDEMHQLFVSGRSGSIRDVCLDSAGALVGILFVVGVVRLMRNYRTHKRNIKR